MFTSLTLALALAAPVPPVAPAPTPAAGPAPRLVELKPADDGKVTVTVNRPAQAAGGVVVIGGIGGANPNGGPIQVQVQGDAPKGVPLDEVKDLTVTTAGGKEVEVKDAMKQLAKGGVVVISADGKKVDPAYLKALKDDVLVLASPELVASEGNGGAGLVLPNIKFQVVPAIPAAPPAPAPAPGK